MIEATSVDVIDYAEITLDDARAAGFESVEELVDQLPGTDAEPLYRVRFRLISEPDPRTVLANDAELTAHDIAAIATRLDRLDQRAAGGAWTRETLRLIATHPARRAPDLAAMAGRDTPSFKRDVRKLKELGLTISLNPGYRLSPRGEAFARAQGI